MAKQNNIISDWLDKYNDPEIDKKVEMKLEEMNKQTKFQVGDKAYKPKGYDFPCTIVGVFETLGGDIRVVGEMDDYGLLHIFNEGQLEPVEMVTTSAEEQLIHLLETQLVDISMMSKIELGDDVIAEINRLKDIIADIKRLQDLYF